MAKNTIEVNSIGFSTKVVTLIYFTYVGVKFKNSILKQFGLQEVRFARNQFIKRPIRQNCNTFVDSDEFEIKQFIQLI